MPYQNPATERLFRAILALQNVEECSAFFEDVCTIREILDIAQRLEVASMLKAGQSYNEITEKTGVSAATISRINRCLHYGTGGYKTALLRLEDDEKKNGTK